MQRREFLKKSYLVFTATSVLASLSGMDSALAAECPINAHLDGEIPLGAAATISSTGQFHHYHYLHVPQMVLNAPPAAGWSTLTSMMVPDLGIDNYFFQKTQVYKQFHCHKVFFSQKQLEAIQKGQKTEVIAYIQGANGVAQKNHTFIFNDTISFEDKENAIQSIAQQNQLKTVGAKCQTQTHGGVRVFSSSGVQLVTSLDVIQSLIGY